MRPEYIIQIVDFGLNVGFRAVVIVHFQGERYTLVSKSTALYYRTAQEAAEMVPYMIRKLERTRTVVTELVRLEDTRLEGSV
jgi:hypothetical protein